MTLPALKDLAKIVHKEVWAFIRRKRKWEARMKRRKPLMFK